MFVFSLPMSSMDWFFVGFFFFFFFFFHSFVLVDFY